MNIKKFKINIYRILKKITEYSLYKGKNNFMNFYFHYILKNLYDYLLLNAIKYIIEIYYPVGQL